MILTCTCKHKFQDKTYGLNKRVHNYAIKGHKSTPGWRCTVCGDVKPAQKMPRQKGNQQ